MKSKNLPKFTFQSYRCQQTVTDPPFKGSLATFYAGCKTIAAFSTLNPPFHMTAKVKRLNWIDHKQIY